VNTSPGSMLSNIKHRLVCLSSPCLVVVFGDVAVVVFAVADVLWASVTENTLFRMLSFLHTLKLMNASLAAVSIVLLLTVHINKLQAI